METGLIVSIALRAREASTSAEARGQGAEVEMDSVATNRDVLSEKAAHAAVVVDDGGGLADEEYMGDSDCSVSVVDEDEDDDNEKENEDQEEE